MYEILNPDAKIQIGDLIESKVIAKEVRFSQVQKRGGQRELPPTRGFPGISQAAFCVADGRRDPGEPVPGTLRLGAARVTHRAFAFEKNELFWLITFDSIKSPP